MKGKIETQYNNFTPEFLAGARVHNEFSIREFYKVLVEAEQARF